MKTIDKNLAMRYNRQISLPGVDIDGQEKLLNSTVLVVGVGGLGCAVAQSLVGAGIGELTLVDDDKVEITNIHRQVLHGEGDIGKPKANSALESLKQINSACLINVIARRLNDDDLADEIVRHHLVLDCSDNLETRNQLNRLCWQHKTPLISGAAIRFEGQLMCFNPEQDTPCYNCYSHLFGEQQLSCSEAGVMPPIVTTVGSLQAMEALKFLMGIGKVPYGELQLFDFHSSQWRSFNVPKRKECPVCSSC